MSQDEKVVLDAIFGRRSNRSYVADKPVEREKIIKLLEAGMAAPSACNIQPWEFVVVTENEMLRRIKESIPQFGNYNAPLIIVVCSYKEFILWDGDDGTIDCSAALENMMIAGKAMGLGSVWVGGFDRASIRELLDIPDKVVPIALAYFGYPAEHPEPRSKYLEAAVYWQKYDPERPHQPRPGSLVS